MEFWINDDWWTSKRGLLDNLEANLVPLRSVIPGDATIIMPNEVPLGVRVRLFARPSQRPVLVIRNISKRWGRQGMWHETTPPTGKKRDYKAKGPERKPGKVTWNW